MESIIQQGEDVLVAPLDFSIGQNSAQYIVSKEEATFFSSQNLVSSNGVKLAKWQVGQPTGFLDLSSFFVLPLQPQKHSRLWVPNAINRRSALFVF